MASTGELVATTLVMWDGLAGRSVSMVGPVGAGEVGTGVVGAGLVVDTERWDLAKAVHLRVHLPPSRAHP
jgi:hypothetical protein